MILNKGVTYSENIADSLHTIISLNIESEYDLGILFRLSADHNILNQYTKYLKKKEHLRPILINSLATNDHYKRAFDFISQYEYDPTLFPQVVERSIKSGVRYLVKCIYFSSKSESLSLYRVMEILDGLPAALVIFVEELFNKGKLEDIQIVCNQFKLWDSLDFMDKANLSKLLMLKKNKCSPKKQDDYFGPDDNKFFKMPITEQDIKFIDSPFKVDLAAPLLAEQIIGLDSEWRPDVCKGHEVKTAILQLSGEKSFVIIDLCKLGNDERLDEFLTKLFSSPSIYKVGLGINGDLNNLAHSYPNMKCFKKIESLIELADVASDSGCKKKSLADICKHAIDKTLCKSETMSNWELRPLRLKQLHYAIADAYTCVLALKKYMEENKLSPENYIYSYTYTPKDATFKKVAVLANKLFDINIIRESRKAMRGVSLIQNNKN
jgi:hypothetical protein